tara:strand:+ start:2648 stop:3085 length:438 start_codon:yes stop_codon:yes gene_type:complete
MPSLLGISWLIPSIPIAGALVIGALLVSFNRTMNRLTKPISFFLISCVSLSTLISFVCLLSDVSGKFFEGDIGFASLSVHLNLYLNNFIDKSLSIVGITIVIAMLSFYYKLERKKGYVRFFSFFSAFAGLILFAIFNGSLTYLFV